MVAGSVGARLTFGHIEGDGEKDGDEVDRQKTLVNLARQVTVYRAHS